MKKTVSTMLMMLVLAVFAQPIIAAPTTGHSYLIDFVVLNANKTIDDRKRYERQMDPILKKHGAEKVQSYVLDQYMAGQLKGASILNIYEMKHANTLAALSSDPDYKKLKGLRNAIHDMKKLTLYVAEPLQNEGQLHSELVLVDLVVMNKGYGHPDRFNYEEKIARIASKYGATISNSFDIDKKLAGTGPDQALKLNLWSISSPEAMQAMSSDTEYKKLATYRNKIHNMNAITLYMASPAVACTQCPI